MLEEHWQKECLAPNSLLESGLLSIFERNIESSPTIFDKFLLMGLFPGSTPWAELCGCGAPCVPLYQ